MMLRISFGTDRTFLLLTVSFVIIFSTYYPRTYAIDDECSILSLAISISRGTLFLDKAGIDLDGDLEWRGRRISKFSPFHAALLAPAVAVESEWKLAFLVTALFTVWGGFIVRGMLLRESLPSEWTLLYFTNPGLLYYSRTLLAMVPAAVMSLLGASLLFRRRPRPICGGMALGAAVLLHIWLAPIALVLSLGWWLERGRGGYLEGLKLAIGALPSFVLLSLYNWITTGSPFRNVYTLLGHQHSFQFNHAAEFLPFYLVSLLIAPLGGWAVFRRQWTGNWTTPVTAATVIAMASAYYYRDGLNYGIVGWIPGQRFLIPISLLAILPAARYLSRLWLRIRFTERLRVTLCAAGIAVFAAGFLLVSHYHQAYLTAQAAIHAAIRSKIPEGTLVVGNDRAFKFFAPVNGQWTLRVARYKREPLEHELRRAYMVWLVDPGERPPAGWFEGRTHSITGARSWVWSRDLWIAGPGSSLPDPASKG